MAIAFDRVQKPLRQLRKLLKNLHADPPAEEVHKLRTRSRQIEAIAAALSPAEEKLTRRLLKSIKPLRKTAGSVRDMDVLSAKARALPQEPGQNSHREALTRLVEHLELSRKKYAAGLVTALVRQRKTARQNLKLYAKQLECGKDSGSLAREREQQVQAAAAQLAAELGRWPALSARNLHSFRLNVKELRSVLQLLSNCDRAFVEALGTVKEQIGDWHDWQQLAMAATEVLHAQQDRALLSAIEELVRQKLREALTAANALRESRLQPAAKKPPASERRLPAQSATASPNRVA
jgi:CHAD domain-containing protein